jgi:hypothetical protein
MVGKKVKTQNYSWKEMCDKKSGTPEPIDAYRFSTRTFRENPHRPYGPKR